MRVCNHAASRRVGGHGIRRTTELDASGASARLVRCKTSWVSAANPPSQLHQIQPQSLNLDPLYLFHCGMQWHQRTDTGAAWELIQALKSSDSQARAIAGSLLAKTENVRVLARDMRRATNGPIV
jgi:hypothetical protein